MPFSFPQKYKTPPAVIITRNPYPCYANNVTSVTTEGFTVTFYVGSNDSSLTELTDRQVEYFVIGEKTQSE